MAIGNEFRIKNGFTFTGTETISAYNTEVRTLTGGANHQTIVSELGIRNALQSGEAFTDYALFQDQKAIGTNGGTATAGAWRVRTLNTTQTLEGTSFSRSGNQITISAGTYQLISYVPIYRTNQAKARWRNITDGTTILYGTSVYSGSFTVVQTYSLITGFFQLASTKTFEVQYRCNRNQANTGLGIASNFDEPEIYTTVTIHKIGG